MEKAFLRLAEIVDLFLDRLDVEKIKRPSGQRDNAGSVDPQALAALHAAKAHRVYLSAETELFAVFSKAVGQASRWFGGCDCHDHIWRLPISDNAKLKKFQKEVGSGIAECVWRGRRGSALARGHWQTLVADVRSITCSSGELQRRLSLVTPQQRSTLVRRLEHLKDAWAEEVHAKLAYWSELPHILFGLWPHDSKSQEIARLARQKWAAIEETSSLEERCHRVTYRLMHPRSGFCFGVMVRSLAETGEMHPDLEIEIRDMNLTPTCEQRIEEVHARISALNKHVGRNLLPATTSARLRQSQNFVVLEDWRAKVFLCNAWAKRPARELLEGVMSKEFCRHANQLDCIRAVNHCLPRQLFADASAEAVLMQQFRNAGKAPTFSLSPNTKLAMDYFKERLPPGCIFSLPTAVLPDEIVGAAASASQATPVAPPACAESTVLGEAMQPATAHGQAERSMKMGREYGTHKFFRVVRTNLSSRFLQHDDPRRGCCIAVMPLRVAGRAGQAGVMYQPTPGQSVCRLDMLALLSKSGMQSVLEELVN